MTAAVPSYRQFIGYFVPLAFQAIAQSLTYPLVAMVASRGPGGPINMAGLAQSQNMLMILFVMGSGLITTGMVFGKTKQGLARCTRINNGIILLSILLYALMCLPPAAHFLFGRLLGLTPAIEKPAITSFMASLPMLILFRLREPYQIVLLNNAATGRAFGATLGRIVLTLMLASVFCALNLVGPIWAVMCMTLAVAIELLIAKAFALPFMRRMTPSMEPPPSYSKLIVFSLTLSVGLLFLTLSGFMVGAFIARAPEPERMLPIFYLAMGLAHPMAIGTTRLQALILTYYGQSARSNRQLAIFTAIAGVIMGLVPLIFLLPGIIYWYYVTLQKLSIADLPLVRNTAWLLILLPLTVALRAYSEGKAAWFRKPVTILTGQAVYLSFIAISAFFALNIGVPGNMLGAVAILFANLAAAGIIMFALRWEYRDNSPAPVMDIEK